MRSNKKILNFTKAYIKSMRLYYSFVTGIAGLIGIALYQYLANKGGIFGNSEGMLSIETPTPLPKLLVILMILFLSWGINQIYNDFLGLKEDRINAPDRPMVSGELNPKFALLLSTVLMLFAFIVTWVYLEESAIYPLIIGVALNVVYEYSKGYGVWANIVFGLMISMCTVYGFLACGKSNFSMFSISHIFFIVYISLINGLMTYYTYFKDYIGDKAAGKKTLIVRLGLEKSQKLSVVFSFLPPAIFLIFNYGFNVWDFQLNGIFVLLGILAAGLQIWTGFLYYTNPKGSMTYFALAMNFRACTCIESAIISIFNPALGVTMFLLSYFFIGFLFNFYVNNKG